MGEFTEQEQKRLARFVTNTENNVFVLKNLPEVIKGALFSRYSRSRLGLRSLLLKEFITDSKESHFNEIMGSEMTETPQDQTLAIQKAQSFYDRILDGYGDDSIGELGGAHLAFEKVSMLAAKAIEDCRIGGSPLEKSTRYIPFDEKENGDFLFYKDSTLLASAYRDLYLDTCRNLFETYTKLIGPLTERIGASFPQEPGTPPGAYQAALRAKVLDVARGLLPVATLTNLGIYGNGRFFEGMLTKLQNNSMSEMQELGKKAFEELSSVIPSFIRRASPEHKTFNANTHFNEAMQGELERVAAKWIPEANKEIEMVKLLDATPDAPQQIATHLLFEYGSASLDQLREIVDNMSPEELEEVLEAACSARQNRRQKSPRALEHAHFTFEFIADFNAYRDLHRHRILTQKRQLISTDLGYVLPEELEGTPEEHLYREAMEKAKETFELIRRELPFEAQYVVPMGYRSRWYFHLNLRALQWIVELRSAPAGHSSYRRIAQEMAKKVGERFPSLERFLKFVDYSGHALGRMDQEIRREARKAG